MGALDFDKNLAVVIGINQYGNGITSLQTAVADAHSVAHLLEQEHDYQVLTLLDQNAQLAGLQNLIHETLPSLLSANSRLLFYFAGHGIAQDGDDGPAGYLIPQDAMPGNTGSYLSMVSLHDALTALPCRHFLAIFDCCFAGAFRWSSTRKITAVTDVIHRERYDRFRQDPAWQVITSASYDQPAMDVLSLRDERGEVANSHDQQCHSPFAVALMQALKGDADSSPPAKDDKPAGDGVITATELYLYLRDQVEVLTESISQRQTPEICTLRNHDKGEFIFLTPGHTLNLPPAPALNKENNPYRGLESFDQAHKDLFFGRDEEIERLLKRLDDPHPMVAVLGASGTGKSSLVKAGLLPQLADNPKYQVLPVMRPGNSPLEALSRSCRQLASEDSVKELTHQFVTDEQSLARLIGIWQQRHSNTHPKAKLLLVIDQAEELITQANTPEESTQFQRLVKRAMAEHWRCFRVVATLRLDFEAQFQDEELKEGWMDSRFVIPPMSQAQLRDAIEKPAEARVLYFEPSSLVDKLVEDVAQTPGALPLLSFTLSELYLRYLERRSDNRALTEEDYRALGGVTGALKERATQEYETLLAKDAAYEKTVKHVMLRMVAVEGGELARRRVPLSELVYSSEAENARVHTLLENLIAARLLVRGQEEESEPYVEPAHDALVRGWDKLLRWKNAEQVSLGLQRELTPQARNWQVELNTGKKGKANGFLWNGNPRLDLLKETLRSDSSWLNELENRFVQRSLERKRNRLGFGVAITVSVMAALGGLAFFGFNQAAETEKQLENSRIVAQSLITDNLWLSKFGLEALGNGLRTAREVQTIQQQNPEIVEPETKMRAAASLWQVVYNIKEKNQLEGHTNWVNDVRFSPNGQTLASASEDGTVRLWQRDGTPITTLEDHTSSVNAVRFSPDGQTLASASEDGTVRLWQRDGTPITTLEDHTSRVTDVRFSPDGQTLASASWDGTVRLWQRDGTPITTLEGHTESVNAVRFSPDGQTLASASEDGTVRLWQRDGTPITTFEGHTSSVNAVRFSPEGQTLASASTDGTVRLWQRDGTHISTLGHTGVSSVVIDVRFSPDGQTLASASSYGTVRLWQRNGTPITTLEGHTSSVNAVRFSPDGQTLASASTDGTVRLWQRDGTPITTLESHMNIVNAVRFSPDGQTLASASDDGTVRLWQRDGTYITTLEGHMGHVNAVRFSPDGQTLASASLDGVRLWQRDGTHITTLEGHMGRVFNVRFSPDGQTLASASEDGTVRLWQRDGTPITTLEGHMGRVFDVRFSPDGQTLASASEDGTVRLWQRDGTPITTLEGHTGSVYACALVPMARRSPPPVRMAPCDCGSGMAPPSPLSKAMQFLSRTCTLVLMARHSPPTVQITPSDYGSVMAPPSPPSKAMRLLSRTCALVPMARRSPPPVWMAPSDYGSVMAPPSLLSKAIRVVLLTCALVPMARRSPPPVGIAPSDCGILTSTTLQKRAAIG